MKIDYCLHSHTFRCGHAVSDIEDYVSLAIAKGYTMYGVSDHVFLPGIHNPEIRGDYSLFSDYVRTYQLVKEKYKNDIKMYLGFECEYSKYFLDYYRSLLKDKGFDYLICGQHCGFDSNAKLYGYFGPDIPLSVAFEKYKKDIAEAMKCGLFLYIAHPDIYFMAATEVNDECKKVTKEIIDLAIKFDAVLEVNRGGFFRDHHRDGKIYIDYPAEYFWKEVAKTNIKVVIGGDFHDPKEIIDERYPMMLDEFIKNTNIKFSDINEIYIKYKEKLKMIL